LECKVIVRDHLATRPQFLKEMAAWIESDQVAWEETITHEIENAPQAFSICSMATRLKKH